jgi:CBS domain-containing protein
MARYGSEMDRHRMGMHDFAENRGYGARQEYGYGGGRGDYRGGARGYGGEYRDDRSGGNFRGLSGGGGQGRGRTGYGGDFGGGRGFDVGPGAGRGGSFGSGGAGDADRVRARDIMTTEPEFVTPDATVADVARKMRDLDVGIVPVVESEENRRLRGVVTDRDLAIRVLADGKDGSGSVREFMTGQVEAVNQNDTVHRILDVMRREQVRRVPVTDRDGRLVGVVAQADLAVRYAGLDLHRETEVEEAIERVSEPAEPRR